MRYEPLHNFYHIVDKDRFLADLKQIDEFSRPMWVGKVVEAIVHVSDKPIRIQFDVSANNRVNVLKIIGCGNNKKLLAELEAKLHLVRVE